MHIFKYYATLLSLVVISVVNAQTVDLSGRHGLNVTNYTDRNGKIISLEPTRALLSFQVDGQILSLADAEVKQGESSYSFSFSNRISGEAIPDNHFKNGWRCRFTIFNKTEDTIEVENVVPFVEASDHIYLTSKGPWALARARIFRPGLGPIGVILPDNAWEMGYGAIDLGDGKGLAAIARRTGSDKAEWRRYKTVIYPGGSVEYTIWADDYQGDWQNGLELMFRGHWLYDVEHFDDTLYRREDLSWIRHSYIIALEFGWNKEYYDWSTQTYKVDAFLQKGKDLFGGYDVFGLWPTWPRLGVDRRNQWDLFADLPGGLDKLKDFSRQWKSEGTRFFICYNPWDESTRSENPYVGMAGLIEATEADGVVLDCHGASSFALQHAADSVRKGVVMYSEGMAVVEDMPGIVAGRVHDAIYMPPPLNLNKLIRPDFAIFRVCQVHDGRIRREASVAFFNGYGTELNTFAPAQLENMEEDLLYLGETTRILRENTSNFLTTEWTPLLPTLKDSIWVNSWPLGDKTIYTVFSLIPEGFNGPLFTGNPSQGKHLISLWHHENLDFVEIEGKSYVPAVTESFNGFDLNTRTEGNIDCIALLPDLITASLSGGNLDVKADRGDILRIWAGVPSYQNTHFTELPPGWYTLSILEPPFNNFEGKYVVQLFENEELLDEKVLFLEPGTPRLISKVEKTLPPMKKDKEMVLIPAGTFAFHSENSDHFIPYPDVENPIETLVEEFYIDRYPVTNKQFDEFLRDSKYVPEDTVNYLKHWDHGRIPPGLDDHPVVYVSLEDASAYASWAGKRLPTEIEWQYAAGGPAALDWPWGKDFDSTLCNNATGATSAVDEFPKGKSPFGVMDLTGNVWQYTNDVYDNGTYYFVMMKGGSHYKPTSSWWYVKGGPQPNYWHQILLLVSPSFDRNATVGFRCVKDAGP